MNDMEIRSGAVSNIFSMGKAVWNSWTVDKATKDGMQASGWVYLAVSKIAEATASVPLVVKDKDGKIVENHAVHKQLQTPSMEMSRTEWLELISSWLSLSGSAFCYKTPGARGQTAELSTISPDRLKPFGSESKLISGYEFKNDGGVAAKSSKYTTDTIIRICKQDPSNPRMGMSPLMAAAKAVDLDVGQQEWNKSLLQNRGNPDIAIMMKSDVDEKQKTSILKSIIRKFRGKRNAGLPLVLGGEAQVTRLGLTQQEMDFLESRKWNRDEILAIFGVPAQLAGAQESSTYNNYVEARRVFWTNTVVPHLNRICEALNSGLAKELGPGFTVVPDLSNVSALSELVAEKADTAEKLSKAGVPMSVISKRLNLGIEEYDGWDKPYSSSNLSTKDKEEERKRIEEMEQRSAELDDKLKQIDKVLHSLQQLAA